MYRVTNFSCSVYLYLSTAPETTSDEKTVHPSLVQYFSESYSLGCLVLERCPNTVESRVVDFRGIAGFSRAGQVSSALSSADTPQKVYRTAIHIGPVCCRVLIPLETLAEKPERIVTCS